MPGTRERSYGQVANIASATGIRGSNPGEAVYNAAKADLVGWNMGPALEVAKSGITVDSVAPGWTATASSTTEKRQTALASSSGCAGRPEEVVAAAVFLAPPEVSFVSGELPVVDGGNCLVGNKWN